MKSNHRQGKRSRMIANALTMLATVIMFAGAAVPTQGQTPTVLHDFTNDHTDACFPEGNVVQGRDGNMYGIGVDGGFTGGCGANGYGAVYKISPAGVESVFFNFPTGWTNCNSGLTLGSDGNLYGTCFTGNPATNQGSLYRLTQAGVFTDLHDFASVNSEANPQYPPIQASDGNFYGTTGSGTIVGTVYRLTPAGVYKNLHTFSGGDTLPSGLFQASDGNLYGTLGTCPLTGNRGCVFKISTGGTLKDIYGFVDATGWGPCSGVIQGKDGKLYGATVLGASTGDQGAIYKLTTAGVITDLHTFNSVTDGDCNSGSFPVVNLLQVTDGSFYGVNPGGGSGNQGSIYKLTSANVFSAFLFPSTNIDGVQPYSTLIQNTNGLVYGTAGSGGSPGSQGTFFSVATGDAPFVNLEPTQKTGNVGTRVGMFGQGFSSASVVKFGGVAATSVTLSGTTYLTAVVPGGAHTGEVTVTTGASTLTSPQTYKVKPKITSFTPPSGPPATLVTITGTGLIQATTVKFGAVKATTFTVISDSEVTAVVPSGLAAGAVKISLTTPGGTANSPKEFTVN